MTADREQVPADWVEVDNRPEYEDGQMSVSRIGRENEEEAAIASPLEQIWRARLHSLTYDEQTALIQQAFRLMKMHRLSDTDAFTRAVADFVEVRAGKIVADILLQQRADAAPAVLDYDPFEEVG